MVRLLRRVLRLGLLAGIGVGVLKLLRGGKGPDPWADSWVSTGPPGGTRPSPAPAATAPKSAQPEKSVAGKSSTDKTASGKSNAAKAEPGKAPTSRTARLTRTGPARKSPTGKAEDPPGERLWVPANDGVCPQSHPVKAKLSSKIFHTPSSRNYSRTKADRCYPDETSAQADGLRPPQR